MPTVEEILGSEAAGLLQHQCKTIPKDTLHLPGPDFVERIHSSSDRPIAVLGRLQSMFDHGRLAGTGYVSILPVDQGIEHSAGASFAPNPIYFDPENIVKLAIEGGCNAVASTLGVLGMCARKYAHKIPFILKFNHNEFISYPNTYDQIRFASIKQAWDMGAVGVGAAGGLTDSWNVALLRVDGSQRCIERNQDYEASEHRPRFRARHAVPRESTKLAKPSACDG
jgi:class I fructose-bisphosphate aldolase